MVFRGRLGPPGVSESRHPAACSTVLHKSKRAVTVSMGWDELVVWRCCSVLVWGIGLGDLPRTHPIRISQTPCSHSTSRAHQAHQIILRCRAQAPFGPIHYAVQTLRRTFPPPYTQANKNKPMLPSASFTTIDDGNKPSCIHHMKISFHVAAPTYAPFSNLTTPHPVRITSLSLWKTFNCHPTCTTFWEPANMPVA